MAECDITVDRLSPFQTENVSGKESGSVHNDSQRRYQQLIDELPAGYIEYDLKGRITYVNEAMLALCTRTKKELRNLSYKEFTDTKTAARSFQAYHQVYRTGVPIKNFVHEIIRRDGKTVTVEGSIHLKKRNGKAVGFRGIWQDITARKKTEQELANYQSRLEAIFCSVKEGIVAVDAKGRVIKANQAVEQICSVAARNIAGKRFTEAQTLCSKSCHAILQDTLSNETETKERQIACRRADRPQQVVVFNCSPLIDANGRSMGAVLVIRDITDLLGLERELRGRYKFHNLIGKSKRMQEVYGLLENLANHETTVLISGESGTGKELVAKALHYAGEKSDRPFVKVNCSALPESLLESELFGHVKGAFTGAVKDRRGRFQAAEGGTILLDEIGDISPLIQLKLLRVLQEKEFERVGESTPKKVNVRVITSTNKNLKAKVRQGEFREDLYYRLKVMEVTVPALRERIEDLPLLADHFCRLFRKQFKKRIEGVSSEVLSRFMNYRWPGNVRELEHALEHAFVLCNGQTIRLGHLPAEIREHVESGPKPTHCKSRKTKNSAQAVFNALEKTGWNKSKAARLLGVNRRTIHRKIKQYDLRKGQKCDMTQARQ